MGLKTRYPLSAIFTKFHVDGAFDFELSPNIREQERR